MAPVPSDPKNFGWGPSAAGLITPVGFRGPCIRSLIASSFWASARTEGAACSSPLVDSSADSFFILAMSSAGLRSPGTAFFFTLLALSIHGGSFAEVAPVACWEPLGFWELALASPGFFEELAIAGNKALNLTRRGRSC